MSWIFVDKEKGGGEGEMRQQMRRNMRRGGNYRKYDTENMGGDFREGYRQGYKHGWEDREDEEDDMDYRRTRDSRGRFI